MNERIILKGMLADTKKKYKDADLEASGLIVSIRTVLNPYEEDLTLIDTEKVLIMAKRLHELVSTLKELKQKIKKIEEDLNG
jgi:uncharacterized phage infection (PIP) family protein YhgE